MIMVDAEVATLVVLGVGHGIAWALLGYLWRGRKAKARRDAASGDLILEYTWRAKGFVIVYAILITGFFSMFLAVVGLPKPSEVPSALGIVLLFGGILGPLALELFGTSVRVNSTGIRQRSAWTGMKRVRWNEVESVSFSEQMGWYRLHTPHGTIRVGAFLNGIPEFLEVARRHLPIDKWTGPAPKSWFYRV